WPHGSRRVALLHQLGVAALHPSRRPGSPGLWAIPALVHEGCIGPTPKRQRAAIMIGHNKIAVLAGGCFWGMEDLFRERPGVVSTGVGYTGGSNTHPTYRNHPGHAEALEITYDPDETDYRALLEFLFQIHNPTTKNRQGNDVGTSYRSAIFYLDDEQKQIAEHTIADVEG